MKVLNAALYGALKNRYGAVWVANPGERLEHYKVNESTAISRGAGRRGLSGRTAYDEEGGERYVIRCPYCHHKRKVYVSYAANSTLRGPESPTHFGQHLVICYRCHFEQDREKRDRFWKALGTDRFVLDGNSMGDVGDLDVDREESGVSSKKAELPEMARLDEPGVPDEALEYVKGRGFDPVELARWWGVGYSEDYTVFRSPHLVVPIWQNSELVAWQGRKLRDEASGPKYWFPASFRKSRILFNMDRARRKRACVICEGVFDAFRVGPGHGVCVFGSTVSRRQTKMLMDFWGRGAVILAFDEDARENARKIVLRWNARKLFAKGARTLELGPRDPAEHERRELWEKIKNCLSRK